MPERLSLLESDAPPPLFSPEAISAPRGKTLVGYALFLANFPEPEPAQRMASVAVDLGSRHGLLGSLHPPERLQITLHVLAYFRHAIAQANIDAVKAASASVTCPPLPIVFDRVMSFTNNNAFVLRCDARSDAAVARLRQSLAVALRNAGLQPEPSRTPHMTMLYDRHHIAEHAIEPISWTATRFALIVSHVGLGHHQFIDQWALASRT